MHCAAADWVRLDRHLPGETCHGGRLASSTCCIQSLLVLCRLNRMSMPAIKTANMPHISIKAIVQKASGDGLRLANPTKASEKKSITACTKMFNCIIKRAIIASLRANTTESAPPDSLTRRTARRAALLESGNCTEAVSAITGAVVATATQKSMFTSAMRPVLHAHLVWRK